MKKQLIRFWMKTPAGKIQFNRLGLNEWSMFGTKGEVAEQIRAVGGKGQNPVNEYDVLAAFDWPSNLFPTYGHIFSEPIQLVEPVDNSRNSESFTGLRQGDKIFGVTTNGDVEVFIKQGIRRWIALDE